MAWVLGLVVAGGLYYLLSSNVRRDQVEDFGRIPQPAEATTH